MIASFSAVAQSVVQNRDSNLSAAELDGKDDV